MKLLLILLFPFTLLAQEESIEPSSWVGQGEIGFEYRRFESDNVNTNADTGVAIVSRVESTFEKEVYKHVFRALGRVDEKDSDRSLVIIEDGYLSMLLGPEESWKILGGYKLFNWTATEAFHPADQINSRNYDSDVESLEKKGELTLELEKTLDNGSFALYFFPKFEEPVYPGAQSRLGFGAELQRPVWVDGGDATTNQTWGVQFGGRFSFTLLDTADLSFHFLHHMNRSFPVIGTHQFVLVGGSPTPTAFPTVPYYYRANQVGITGVLPIESFIFKLEAATRKFDNDLFVYTTRGLRRPEDNTEVALGMEWSIAHESGAETYLFMEGQMMFGPEQSRIEEMSLFQKDIFLGLRYAFNDVMGRELFFSFIFDVEREHEYLFNLSYTQRLSDLWKIKTGIRYYDAPQKGSTVTGLELYDGDSYIYGTLTRYF